MDNSLKLIGAPGDYDRIRFVLVFDEANTFGSNNSLRWVIDNVLQKTLAKDHPVHEFLTEGLRIRTAVKTPHQH